MKAVIKACTAWQPFRENVYKQILLLEVQMLMKALKDILFKRVYI